MTTQYFRVTAYHPAGDISAIFDSNGMYEKLWQLSAYLIGRGFNVLEVSTDEKFLDVNVEKAEADKEHIICRAYCKGRPETTTYKLNGVIYHAIKIKESIYIPDRDKIGGAL